MLKHIPNFLTCSNLVCGCLGIITLIEGGDTPIAYFVWAACVFDFLDGFAARLLKVSSPIGKELDSLADMISFGALPSLFMYVAISFEPAYSWVPYVAVLIAVCSALRLAIFNLDETQSDSFKGLPTPANAIFITAIPFVRVSIIHCSTTLAIISVVFALLLVSRIDLFALKFKNFTWHDNQVRFTFLGAAVLLLAVLKFAALPLIILLYILLSLGVRMFSRK